MMLSSVLENPFQSKVKVTTDLKRRWNAQYGAPGKHTETYIKKPGNYGLLTIIAKSAM